MLFWAESSVCHTVSWGSVVVGAYGPNPDIFCFSILVLWYSTALGMALLAGAFMHFTVSSCV